MSGSDKMHPIYDEWGRMRSFDFCSETEPEITWAYMTWINPATQVLRVRNKENTAWITIGGGGGPGTDEKVKVSSNDVLANYLIEKLAAGAGISISEQNDGGDEDAEVAVDATVVRTSGAQTITGQKTFQDDIVLDDGAGDSPEIKLVGGSNDDTARIRLKDDEVTGDSWLEIWLPGDDESDTKLVIRDVDGNILARVTVDSVDCFKGLQVVGLSNFIGNIIANTAIRLVEQAADPSPVSNCGMLYPKDDGGDTELFYEDDDGDVTQITKDGALAASGVPAGLTAMWYQSDTPPTGWSVIAGAANRVLRAVTSGAGGTAGTATHSHELVGYGPYANQDFTLNVWKDSSTGRLVAGNTAGANTWYLAGYATDAKSHLYNCYEVLLIEKD